MIDQLVRTIYDRIDVLQQQRAVLEDYLTVKRDEKDWHGVADACMDIREIEAEERGLRFAVVALGFGDRATVLA